MRKKLFLIITIFIMVISTSYSASYKGELIAEGKNITIDFKDVELLDVIRLLARKFDLNLIAGNDVSGKVTVTFEKVPVDDALETILDINGYAYMKVGNIIRVIPIEKARSMTTERVDGQKIVEEPKVKKIYNLKYVSAEYAKSRLKQILSSEAEIIAEEKLKKIIAWLPDKDIDKFNNYLKEIDIKELEEEEVEVTEEFEIEIFKVKYLEPEELKQIIVDLKPSLEKNVRINSTLKSLVVEGSSNVITVIGSLVEDFDTPPLQVKIEAKVIEIEKRDNEELGVEWNTSFPQSNIEEKTSMDLLKGGKNNTIEYGLLNGNSFKMTLNSLLGKKNTNILATPNITTITGETATINIEKETVTYVSTGGEDSGIEEKSSSEGTKLEVTPTIIEDGRIILNLIPEISKKEDENTTSKNDLTTSVIVGDNETLAIGGLTREDKTSTINSVPILGDLPFIGRLFQNVTDEIVKKDLILFITPTIIKTRPFMNSYKVKSDKEIIMESFREETKEQE